VDEIKTDWTGSDVILGQLMEIARSSALAEMASGVAHELNQPLGAIATFSQAGERMLNRPADRRHADSAAQHRLELAKLGRLEAARALQAAAKARELERGHRLEHVDLGDEGLEDLQDPVEQVERRVGVARIERAVVIAPSNEITRECLRPDISDPETVVELAAEVGVDGRAALTDESVANEVRADEREAAELGITGVPFFVLGRRYAVSGAQPPELLLQALQQAWADTMEA